MAESLINREELHQHYLSRVTILLDDAYQNGWNAGYERATRDMREANASQLRAEEPETPEAPPAGTAEGQREHQTTTGPLDHASETHEERATFSCARKDLTFGERLTCGYVQMYYQRPCRDNHAPS